jgi:hypothetical protein
MKRQILRMGISTAILCGFVGTLSFAADPGAGQGGMPSTGTPGVAPTIPQAGSDQGTDTSKKSGQKRKKHKKRHRKNAGSTSGTTTTPPPTSPGGSPAQPGTGPGIP